MLPERRCAFPLASWKPSLSRSGESCADFPLDVAIRGKGGDVVWGVNNAENAFCVVDCAVAGVAWCCALGCCC